MTFKDELIDLPLDARFTWARAPKRMRRRLAGRQMRGENRQANRQGRSPRLQPARQKNAHKLATPERPQPRTVDARYEDAPPSRMAGGL
jgi:hypothetical protein